LSRLAYADKNRPDFKIDEVSEQAFKQRYAEEAVRIGQKYGITKDGMRDIVRGVYAFEDGGKGTRELLSGIPAELMGDDKTAERRDYRPASTAIGYTQVLMMSTLGRVSAEGDKMAAQLSQMAQADPARAPKLVEKADMLTHLQQTLDCELKAYADAKNAKLPDGEKKNYYDAEGKAKESLFSDFTADKEYKTSSGLTGREFATAVHGLNLDGDIGPMIQIRQLSEDIGFAQKQGFLQKLDAKVNTWNAQAGAYDALPQEQKSAAVAEVMGLIKPSGEDAKNPTKLAAFDAAKTSLTGRIQDMKLGSAVGNNKLSDTEYDILNNQVMKLNHAGDGTYTLSQNAQNLLSKIASTNFDGLTAAKLMPAAIELSNLAGAGQAKRMLSDDNGALPTTNFFQRNGYEGNPVVARRTADVLLFQIYRNMNGPNGDFAKRPEQVNFDRAFAAVPAAPAGPQPARQAPARPDLRVAPPQQRGEIPALLRANNDAMLREVNEGPPQPISIQPDRTLKI
jgi:hypothetical protein